MSKKLKKQFEAGFNHVGKSIGMQFGEWLQEYSNGHQFYTYTLSGKVYTNHSGVEDGERDGRQAARKNREIRRMHGELS
jgi:hypothetical protein